MSARDQLLVVIDPVARRTDGESVRIAKDVLGAGAAVRICLPEGPEDFAKALARRGTRRPVVIGDDRALLRAVAALHRERELHSCAVSVVPVGAVQVLSRSLGVPIGAVAAARAVLEGAERRLDLLVDDSDGVVLGTLRIPPVAASASESASGGASGSTSGSTAVDGHPWLRTCQSFVRTLARPSRVASAPGPAPARLRVEADGVLVVDLDQPVEGVSVRPGSDGFAEVEVRPTSVGAAAQALRVRARTITVSGADFRYRADAVVGGPVRTRTWAVRASAWGLMLPR
ncbi:diacylglycerol kinase [Streptomyces durmitorensis]|uniref:Diacylglycerol kinase n=1 Tax=Streptomyces durmitorensis TaxID=319947 RepID=A0ABY4PWS7_9ACTN|nr:diacylglycerol kinase family protein [Streptomyces durmitorensis]UQT57328.1 diacylglycerol kinase [Streptomyces durmitorensis]